MVRDGGRLKLVVAHLCSTGGSFSAGRTLKFGCGGRSFVIRCA